MIITIDVFATQFFFNNIKTFIVISKYEHSNSNLNTIKTF